MSLELLDRISLPGDATKPNEDAFAHVDQAALVMDGATPLGPSLLPGPSDAAWIAQFGARRLIAHLKDGDAPRDALKHALADAEKSFSGLAREAIREKWQTPCASMMMVVDIDPLRPTQPPEVATARGWLGSEPRPTASVLRTRGEGGSGPRLFQFLWFGDCAAIVVQEDQVSMIGETLEKRQAEAARAKMVARAAGMSSASGINRPEIEPMLRAARNRINSGRNWLFSPDRRAAAHAAHQTANVRTGALLLLASDGFLALVSDYGRYDGKSLVTATLDRGLAALGE